MRKTIPTRVELFQYPASAKPIPPVWKTLLEIGTASAFIKTDGSLAQCTSEESSEKESSIAGAVAEAQRKFEEGRELGMRDASEKAATERQTLVEEAEKQRVKQAANLAEQFAVERDRLLQTVEHEVVNLALAIAERILRREAQSDPLFLIGAVRVALGQLAETLTVKLRIPTSEAELWIETLAHLPNLKIKPTVVPEDRMQLGDCVLESEMGSVDL